MNNYKNYAKVLLEEAQNKNSEEFDKFFIKFIDLLKSKKHLSLLPKIYQEVENILKTDTNQNQTILIVKNKKIADVLRKKIEKYSDTFDLDNLETKEEEKIVGGFILKNKKYIVDNSYKKKLIALYKKLVA